MKVINGCESSGTVRDAFIKKGHDAISCDMLPTDKPGPHYQGDIFHMLCSPIYSTGFDLGIFHPPCTYLCNSGVRWLWNKDGTKNEERWVKMRESAMFFKTLLHWSGIDSKAIENPIMHKYAMEIIGVRPTQIIQPWQFGHTAQKATCLWLVNLPKLKPTEIIPKEQRTQEIWLCPPGPDRWKIRSKTFQGIADAMADQWGSIDTRIEQPEFTRQTALF